jgi:hypothetical protein
MNTHTEQTKWTPGPWRIGDAGTTIFGPPNGTPFPKTIASITNNPFPSKSQRANARLIAAAPCLLEACKVALQYFPSAGEVYNQIAKVVAHAEGREM